MDSSAETALIIKKPTLTYPIHRLLESRWSPRAFNGVPVEQARLQRIFEAARWAPSSMNLQPWNFIVGLKNSETYDQIYSVLAEFNQLWAGTAPVLVLAVANLLDGKGNPNGSHAYDLGAAVAMLTVQASAEGLYVHQMGGFDKAKAEQLFKIPASHKAITALAIGNQGDPEQLHPNLKKLELTPRQRKPLSDMVFSGEFGKASPIA
jgi:nitroreductase